MIARGQTYINPFIVLERETGKPLESLDREALLRLTRIKLAECDLSDTRTLDVDGLALARNEVRDVLRELADPKLRQYHHMIFLEPALCRFLTHGDASLFACSPWYPRGDGSPYSAPEFEAFISPYFALQYRRILLGRFQAAVDSLSTSEPYGKLDLVCWAALWPLLEEDLPLTPEETDLVFSPVYALLHKEILGRLKTILCDMQQSGECGSTRAGNEVLHIVKPDLLNLLPDYFQNLRNEIADAATSIAAQMQSLDPRSPWKELVRRIRSLVLTGSSLENAEANYTTFITADPTDKTSVVPGLVLMMIGVVLLVALLSVTSGSRTGSESRPPKLIATYRGPQGDGSFLEYYRTELAKRYNVHPSEIAFKRLGPREPKTRASHQDAVETNTSAKLMEHGSLPGVPGGKTAPWEGGKEDER